MSNLNKLSYNENCCIIKGEQGTPGRKGPEGDKGKRGPRGFIGEKGETGYTGHTGHIGDIGPTGYTGCTDTTGPSGTQFSNVFFTSYTSPEGLSNDDNLLAWYPQGTVGGSTGDRITLIYPGYGISIRNDPTGCAGGILINKDETPQISIPYNC